MKSVRQAKLTELIKNNIFDTQEELQIALRNSGFDVTQATVSRDIRELGIIKAIGDDGVYKYCQGASREKTEISGKFSLILRQAVSKVNYANNLIVLKTYTGMGSAVGAAIDALELDGIIGTLAGDDTLLIIASDNDTAEELTKKINELIAE